MTSPAPGRRACLTVTVPMRLPDLTVAVEVEEGTAKPTAIAVLYGSPGSDLDALGRQLCALMNLALLRGWTLAEIGMALPREGVASGPTVQLAQQIVASAVDQLEAAKASLASAGLLSEPS